MPIQDLPQEILANAFRSVRSSYNNIDIEYNTKEKDFQKAFSKLGLSQKQNQLSKFKGKKQASVTNLLKSNVLASNYTKKPAYNGERSKSLVEKLPQELKTMILEAVLDLPDANDTINGVKALAGERGFGEICLRSKHNISFPDRIRDRWLETANFEQRKRRAVAVCRVDRISPDQAFETYQLGKNDTWGLKKRDFIESVCIDHAKRSSTPAIEIVNKFGVAPEDKANLVEFIETKRQESHFPRRQGKIIGVSRDFCFTEPKKISFR